MGIVSMMETPVTAQIKELNAKTGGEIAPIITDIIFSVDPRTNKVNNYFIRNSDTELQLYKLKENCYRCNYYLGHLEGGYQLKGSKLIPNKKSVFTIKTTHNLMPGEIFDPGIKFPPGAFFSMAGIKTTVVENQRGIFKVKTN